MDFLQRVITARTRARSFPPRVRVTFTTANPAPAIGFQLVWQSYPQSPPDMISISHATVTYLAFGYILAATDQVQDFHPLGRVHATR